MFYIWVVIGYLVLLFAVGISKVRRVKTQDDFMVAGRTTPTILLVGTLICTWIGSGSLFGGAGLAFRMGFSELWMSAGAWVGIAIVYFLAHRVRRIAEYTVSDILEKRYNKWARIFGTLAIIIAYLTIAGYQFRGGGRLINILTGLDPAVGAAITCAIVIAFTMLAGLLSIIAVDLFNGIVMTLGVIIGVPLLLAAVGGWQQLQALPPDHFTVFGKHDWVWAAGVFFPTFFLLLGESSMYQKFFAAKDEQAARRAVIGMIIGVIFIESMLCTLSVIGSAKYLTLAPFANPDGALNKAETETIILQVARYDLPRFAGGLMMAAAVAIILSTANTFLMIPSTNLTRDIYQRFINPQVSQEKIVQIQRLLIVVLGIVAYVVATFFKSILDMAFTAYTMVGAGVTPALLAAFLWKRTSVAGGVASIAAGMLVTIAVTAANFILPEPVMETDYIIIPAAGASIIALIVVSLLTPPPPEEKWKPFWMETK
ncbi:MAG: sodium:solute symporter family protein [candidate division KSB1 bacterium]|nr:sodium:solute symporter family protein [candidate division KSB1 bacterium]MDZ7364597.1 sodium:solute symporter family protein [candidate division KSB1 bacterium]MDZ7402655.1 sodium:solute symporter family protein [candidate division KSB1 bacterium]